MIYTKARVWSELGNPAQFSDCPLWVVDYHSTDAADRSTDVVEIQFLAVRRKSSR